MNRANVRVVQSRCRLCFALKAAKGFGLLSHFIGQELQSNETVELQVLGLVHHTHATAPYLFEDAVVRNYLADHWAEILRPQMGQVNVGG